MRYVLGQSRDFKLSVSESLRDKQIDFMQRIDRGVEIWGEGSNVDCFGKYDYRWNISDKIYYCMHSSQSIREMAYSLYGRTDMPCFVTYPLVKLWCFMKTFKIPLNTFSKLIKRGNAVTRDYFLGEISWICLDVEKLEKNGNWGFIEAITDGFLTKLLQDEMYKYRDEYLDKKDIEYIADYGFKAYEKTKQGTDKEWDML